MLAHGAGMLSISTPVARRSGDTLRASPADAPPGISVDADDIVSLPEVARHVLDIVFADAENVPSHRSLIWVCVRFGVSRHLLGQPERMIDEDLALLELAADQRVRRTVTDDAQRERALILLDRSIEIAVRAAKLGFDREALRARGRWDAELQRVLRTSPFVSAA